MTTRVHVNSGFCIRSFIKCRAHLLDGTMRLLTLFNLMFSNKYLNECDNGDDDGRIKHTNMKNPLGDTLRAKMCVRTYL